LWPPAAPASGKVAGLRLLYLSPLRYAEARGRRRGEALTMYKVVFLTNLAPETAELLTRHAPAGYDVTTAATSLPDAEQAALLADADFLILFPGVIAAEALAAAPRLKLIQLVSAGFDQLDLNLCRELGI